MILLYVDDSVAKRNLAPLFQSTFQHSPTQPLPPSPPSPPLPGTLSMKLLYNSNCPFPFMFVHRPAKILCDSYITEASNSLLCTLPIPGVQLVDCSWVWLWAQRTSPSPVSSLGSREPKPASLLHLHSALQQGSHMTNRQCVLMVHAAYKGPSKRAIYDIQGNSINSLLSSMSFTWSPHSLVSLIGRFHRTQTVESPPV